MGAQETVVGTDLDRDPDLLFPAFHRLKHPPFAGFRDPDPVWRMTGDCAPDLASEGSAVVRIVELHIIDGPAVGFQRAGMVAHGREQEGDLLAVVRDVIGFFNDLHHQHPRRCRVGVAKRR
jgi:hypothetical protein